MGQRKITPPRFQSAHQWGAKFDSSWNEKQKIRSPLKPALIYLGASSSSRVFRRIGRGNGDGIVGNPTPVPLGVSRVNGEQIFCFLLHQKSKLPPDWSELLDVISSKPTLALDWWAFLNFEGVILRWPIGSQFWFLMKWKTENLFIVNSQPKGRAKHWRWGSFLTY